MGAYPPLFGHTLNFLFRQGSKFGFGREPDSQGRYRRKNTGYFNVSAARIQWKTSRTRIRPPKTGTRNQTLFCRVVWGTISVAAQDWRLERNLCEMYVGGKLFSARQASPILRNQRNFAGRSLSELWQELLRISTHIHAYSYIYIYNIIYKARSFLTRASSIIPVAFWSLLICKSLPELEHMELKFAA